MDAGDRWELEDKVRRLEAELSRERGRNKEVGGGDTSRLRLETERLEEELRRKSRQVEQAESQLSELRQSSVSVERERELTSRVDKLSYELDLANKKLLVSRTRLNHGSWSLVRGFSCPRVHLSEISYTTHMTHL